MVKAVAAKENLELRSHASLWEYIDKLAEKLQDVELRRLWWTANIFIRTFMKTG
jgi:xylose isomerase